MYTKVLHRVDTLNIGVSKDDVFSDPVSPCSDTDDPNYMI